VSDLVSCFAPAVTTMMSASAQMPRSSELQASPSDELQAVIQIEHLGVNLFAIDVEQSELFSDAADEAGVRDRRPTDPAR